MFIEPASIWNKADITKTDPGDMKARDVKAFNQIYNSTPVAPDTPNAPADWPRAPLVENVHSNDYSDLLPEGWQRVNANPAEFPSQLEVGTYAPQFEASEWEWTSGIEEGSIAEYLGFGPLTVVSGKWERTYTAEHAVHLRTVPDGEGGYEFEVLEVKDLTITEVQHQSGVVLGIDGPPGAPSLALANTDSPDGFWAGPTTDFDTVYSISYDPYIYQGEGASVVFDQPMQSIVLESGDVYFD